MHCRDCGRNSGIKQLTTYCWLPYPLNGKRGVPWLAFDKHISYFLLLFRPVQGSNLGSLQQYVRAPFASCVSSCLLVSTRSSPPCVTIGLGHLRPLSWLSCFLPRSWISYNQIHVFFSLLDWFTYFWCFSVRSSLHIFNVKCFYGILPFRSLRISCIRVYVARARAYGANL